MIYIIKPEGLYQNKVTSTFTSIHNCGLLNNKLLDEVFVICRIIKVEVRVISRSRRVRPITLTETLIILDITKTKSNNLFYYTLNDSFLSRFDIRSFQSLCQLFFFLRFSQFFLFHVISKQLLCHLRRPFCVCESLSSTTFSMSC